MAVYKMMCLNKVACCKTYVGVPACHMHLVGLCLWSANNQLNVYLLHMLYIAPATTAVILSTALHVKSFPSSCWSVFELLLVAVYF